MLFDKLCEYACVLCLLQGRLMGTYPGIARVLVGKLHVGIPNQEKMKSGNWRFAKASFSEVSRTDSAAAGEAHKDKYFARILSLLIVPERNDLLGPVEPVSWGMHVWFFKKGVVPRILRIPIIQNQEYQ